MKLKLSAPDFVRRSLSSRLSVLLALMFGILMLAALDYVFTQTRKGARQEAEGRAEQVLDNTVLRVNGILEDVEIAADNLEWLILRDITDPDKMREYSNEIVRNNAILNSCSVSFEPYFYPEKGRYYSIFSYRGPDDTVLWKQEGDDSYQYFYLDWYLMPRLLQKPCWTEPYNDLEETDDKVMDTGMIVSYCKPVFTADSVFVGSFSLDVSLQWLSETISAVRPYPNAYCILVGRGGTYLVHPDPEKLFFQTIFTEGLDHPDPEAYELGRAMRERKQGMMEMKLGGEKNYVFYKSLPNIDWSVAIICPDSDIFGPLDMLHRTVVIIVLMGLLLMMLLAAWLIHRQLSPLSALAVQAESIAAGNLEKVLPETDRYDEIGVLSQSFRDMQSSLVRQIDELTKATAARERLDRELQIARGIQMAMVPHTFPEREDIDLYALMTPAREVGGDLYDFFIEDEKLYFCIGDVSGKGIPASLMMAVAKSMFRILAKQGLPPADIARQINDIAAEDNAQMIFVTMFFGTLDLSTGVLSYCNAGHNAPVVLRRKKGKSHFLPCKPNMAIGIMPGFEFEGETLEDFRGDTLFVYTDGLNEAENAAHEQFGNERMLEILGENQRKGARDIIEIMNQAVAAHVDGAEASDDLTMLCVRMAK